MNLSRSLAQLTRAQRLAATAIVWAVATVVTGWIMADFFSAAIGTTTGVSIFVMFYLAAKDRQFDRRIDILRWLIDIRRPSRRDVEVVAAVIALGLASRLTLGTVHSLLLPSTSRGVHDSVAAPEPSLVYIGLLVAGAVVIGPIFEELVFRNGLQKLLADYTGWPAAIAATSLLFALFHVPSYGGFGEQIPVLALPLAVVFVDSLLYGIAYWRTSNILVAMAAHGLSNGVAVLSYAL